MQGPPGAADVTLAFQQQQLAGVAAQLRAVDADIQAARAAGDAHEVKALREEKRLLLETQILLLRVRVRGPDDALQPGMCLLLASRFPCLTARN